MFPMEAQRERPWTNDEKNYLLAEIIKLQSPHPSVLYNVAEQLNIQPHTVNWNDIVLPPGRTVNSSRSALDEIRRQPRSSPSTAYGPQTPLSAPPVPKRPFPDPPFATGREIRPKLAPYPTTSTLAQASGSGQQTPKRRRGRPPKNTQPQTSAEPSVATPYLRPLAQASLPTISAAATSITVEETKAPLPPTTRMPISAVLTPMAQKTASNSSSSSGKRRRGRSTKSEPEEFGQMLGPSGQEYESPYGRAEGGLEDTPAKAAVLRHRDEPTSPPPPPTAIIPENEPRVASAGSE